VKRLITRTTAIRHAIALCLAVIVVSGCTSGSQAQRRGAPVEREFSMADLAKTDVDQVAEIHLDHSMASLKLVMEKLYRRNPRELHKNADATIETAIGRAFDPTTKWTFAEFDNRRGIEVLHLAFRPEYAGDRVFAFVAGLGGMIFQAYNEQQEFYLLDRLDPQNLYNAARNIEIAAWKLSTARDPHRQLLLLSNESATVHNLSFEREFGKLIAYQDVLAHVLAQRSNRALRFVVQNAASAVFLPIY
jgi:hypothetical protein